MLQFDGLIWDFISQIWTLSAVCTYCTLREIWGERRYKECSFGCVIKMYKTYVLYITLYKYTHRTIVQI